MFAVIRRERANGKTFSQWTPVPESGKEGAWLPVAPSSNRPMYFLPDVLRSTGSIGIVEGEKCAHALRDAWPNKPVTTWAGGTNAWQLTDWTSIAGRDVSLLADGDNPGHKAMEALAAHLHSMGCRVQIARPPTDWKSDVADWLVVGKAHAAKIIYDLLVAYEPLAAPELNKESESDDIDKATIRKNDKFQIVGLAGDDHIAIKRLVAGRMWLRTFEQIQQITTLNTLAEETWWCAKLGIDQMDQKQARRIGGEIIKLADERGQYNPSLTRGRGAIRITDNKIAYHLGDRILIDGQECPFDDGSTFMWLTEPRMDLGDAATDRQVAAIARAVLDYRWASEDDGRKFLGWIVAAMVGGALEWRPHLWLTSPAGTGKTWLFDNVLLKLLGNAMPSLADTTPAGLARFVGASSLPIVIDEAEPTHPWVVNLLDTLRAASSGAGARLRADAHGGYDIQQSRFSAILSSTISPNLPKADATRIAEIGLSTESVENWPMVQVAIQVTMKAANNVRYKIFREAQNIIGNVDELVVDMQSRGMDSREALSSAALTVGWRWWGVDTKEIMSQPETTERTDASDALLEILALRYNAPGRVQPVGGPDVDERYARSGVA